MEKSKLNQKEVINRTGSLMLKGWKLLSITCPICHTALLSKDNQMRCPGCDMPVLKEGQVPAGAVEQKSDNVTTAVSQPTKTEVKEEEEEEDIAVQEPSSYEELRREYDEKNKKSSAVSSKLGEKMLQGWTMLADSCPDFDQCGGTPLMKNPVTSTVICVSCNKEYFYGVNGDLIPKNDIIPPSAGKGKEEVVKAVSQPSANAPSRVEDFPLDEFDDQLEEPPRIVNFQQKKEDDSSWKISQKLLLGWSLLDSSCTSSKCNGRTPLLRDLKGRRYCVDCGFIDEAKAEAKPVASATPKKTAQALIEEEDNEEEDEQKVQALFSSAKLTTVKSATKTFSSVKSVVSSSEVDDVKDDVIQVLTKKLRSAANDLEHSNSIEASLQYALLITRLAESLKAIQSL